MFNLEIEIEEPNYDSEGRPIHDDDMDVGDMPGYLEGLFDANLLDYSGWEREAALEQELLNQPKEENELKEEFKRHLNVDFDENDERNEDYYRRRSSSIKQVAGGGLAGELE